jgi:hypothetical protein
METPEDPGDPGDSEVKKERRGWTERFDGAKDECLEIRLEHRRDGSWRTYGRPAIGAGKARKHARGATQLHTAEATARTAHDALIAAALRAGWRKASRARAGSPLGPTRSRSRRCRSRRRPRRRRSSPPLVPGAGRAAPGRTAHGQTPAGPGRDALAGVRIGRALADG